MKKDKQKSNLQKRKKIYFENFNRVKNKTFSVCGHYFKSLLKSQEQTYNILVLLGILVVLLLLLVKCNQSESVPSVSQNRCYEELPKNIILEETILFKKVDLCHKLKTNQGNAEFYIGKIREKSGNELSFACIILGETPLIDFENAPAFFYIESIYEKLSMEVREQLCVDIQKLLDKYLDSKKCLNKESDSCELVDSKE